jgi:LAO/AO transport system kinase
LSATVDVAELIARHREGGGWAHLARALTAVENAPPWEVVPASGPPTHVVGVTGPPGAGKSTLTGRLIEGYGDAGARIAVLAVDPSSPLTGGAVLGDRIRMEESAQGREGVYVRSLASRGSAGAVAGATRNAVRLLEACEDFDVIVIETVGAGQTEISVASLADTVLFVTVPGLGDGVQADKAGIIEVADMLVVNKADRPGAAQTARDLRVAVGRAVPVLQTAALDGQGVDVLREALDARWTELSADGRLPELRAAREASEAAVVAEAWVRRCAERARDVTEEPAGDMRATVQRILREAAETWRTT